jgi:hypothetical protein
MPEAPQPVNPDVVEISVLLRAWSGGNQSALDKLTPILYQELHRLGRPLHAAGASWARPAAHRTGERSLPSPG